ncbi:MAG: LamG-like jellyroll fold domain-containing protein [Vicinamibacterales bacterium]
MITTKNDSWTRRRQFLPWRAVLAITFVSIASTWPERPARAQAGGLVLAYAFEEGTGPSVTDASGQDHTATVSGATWAAGKNGSALNFDGNDFVTVNDLDLTGSLTVMAWVRTRSLYPTTCASIVMKAHDYGLEICEGTLYAGVGANGSWTARGSQVLTAADLDVWRHVAFTYDGTTLRFFVDATLVSSAAGAHASNNEVLRLGRWSSASEFLDGLVDDVRIYDRALTAEEILVDRNTPVGTPSGPPPSPSPFQNDIIVANLSLPTNIEFLPDGTMLIGELGGTIQQLRPGASQVEPTPFLTIANIGTQLGQQGLMDIELDPDFATNGHYYVFYTRGTPNNDLVSRFTASTASTVPGSELVIWQDSVAANAEHHGGAINFGADGKLYITVGDHFDASDAQRLTSYHGKILRVNKDGTIPEDNPFHDGAGPNRDEIWALGLRNPFRASVDRATGRYYVGDVGGNDYSVAAEELNLGVAGANYGWPICEGSCVVSGMTNPIFSYPHNGRDASITAGFIYRGSQFPAEYIGSFFYADYTQNWIRRLTFDADGNVSSSHFFVPEDETADGPYGDIVHLTLGPDGALYYTDLGFSDVGGTFGVSKIRRVSYTPPGDQPPAVVATASPLFGLPPLTVGFSSAGSSDPEGQPLIYHWEFGDGTTADTADATHVYFTSGRYTAVLTVSDGSHFRNSTPLTINVGSPPVATILAPATGGTFRAGDVITFSGAGTDPDDGPLPDTAFSWAIDFHHESHVHPGLPLEGVASGSLAIPSSGHDYAGNTRYEIRLTVTDSTGLQARSSVFVFPQKVNLTFNTIPVGLTLRLDGISQTTPFVRDSLVNFTHQIEAPDQTSGTTSYSFDSWTDSGAQAHVITVPDADAAYVASFSAGTPPPPSGLVAAYGFDEGTGTVLIDASGNGRDGTIAGATWTLGKYGQALDFDGTDSVTLLDLDLTGAFSVMGWMLTRTLHSNTCGSFVMKAYDYGFEICEAALYAKIGSGVGFTASVARPLTTADLNVWRHVALTYDGAALRMYFDGALVNQASGPHTGNNLLLRIGRWTSSTEFWDGSIDEVRIYDRALTGSEVQAVRNLPIGQTPARLTILQPAAAATVTGSTVDVSYTISGDASEVARVYFQLDAGSEVFDSDTDGAFQFTSVPIGPHVIHGFLARADQSRIANSEATVNFSTVLPDSTPPTAPPDLAAAANGTDVTLTWSAATDDVGVVDYRVERCEGEGCSMFAEVASTDALSYADSGLLPNTTYVYRVRATDAAGNWGLYSETVSTTTHGVVEPAGLAAAYGFEDGTGSLLTDSSGNGRHGTVAGASWVQGKYGLALEFNGDDLVTIGNLDLTGSFTVMAWMQTRSLYTNTCGSIVMKAYDYGFEICGGILKARVGTGGSFAASVSDSLTNVDLSVWKHVAMTYDGSVLRMYIDGSLVGQAAGSHVSGTTPLLFGRWSSNVEFWNGLIDEVRIYDRVLSGSEILTTLGTPVSDQ